MDFWSQKLAQTYYQYLESNIITHLNGPFLLTFSTQNQDMCYDIDGSGLIEIESQLDGDYSTL